MKLNDLIRLCHEEYKVEVGENVELHRRWHVMFGVIAVLAGLTISQTRLDWIASFEPCWAALPYAAFAAGALIALGVCGYRLSQVLAPRDFELLSDLQAWNREAAATSGTDVAEPLQRKILEEICQAHDANHDSTAERFDLMRRAINALTVAVVLLGLEALMHVVLQFWHYSPTT